MTDRFIPSEANIVSRCRAIIKPGQYMILPQANRVESMLPGFENTVAQVLTTSSPGARFIQHELHMAAGGKTVEPIQDEFEHFLFVLEGGLSIEAGGEKKEYSQGGYAYLPVGLAYSLANPDNRLNRVLWTRKRYKATGSLKPAPIFSSEQDVPALPVDTYMEQHLVPYEEDMAYGSGLQPAQF